MDKPQVTYNICKRLMVLKRSFFYLPLMSKYNFKNDINLSRTQFKVNN